MLVELLFLIILLSMQLVGCQKKKNDATKLKPRNLDKPGGGSGRAPFDKKPSSDDIKNLEPVKG